MKGEINESKFRYLPKSALGVSFCQTSPFKVSDEESLSIDLVVFTENLGFAICAYQILCIWACNRHFYLKNRVFSPRASIFVVLM